MPEEIVLKLKDTPREEPSLDGDINAKEGISVLLPLNLPMDVLGIRSFKTVAINIKF